MFHISLEHSVGKPMYQQIYQYIVKEIQQGGLTCHERLPSARALAQDLNISRNTVNMAYAQLESEGYIEAIERRGYFVNELDGLLSMSGIETKSMKPDPVMTESPYAIDFSPFGIALDHAPYHCFKKLMRETMLDGGRELFQIGDSQGEPGLRRAIKEYLHRSRGVNCSEEQIVIGAGTDYLLMLLTRLFQEPQGIAMENPVYLQAYRVFQNFNYPIFPIPLDEGGLDIQALRSVEAKLVFVTPSHQFPMGIVMPINRRRQLLNWAYEAPDRFIIEDDYDSEFRYQGKPIPSLQGIDTRGRVIYLGTLSKAIAPSIRMGYMVLPEQLYQQYRKRAAFYATTVSRIHQETVRRFLVEGYFERHLNRMRGIYRSKHDYILKELARWGEAVSYIGHSAGLHLLLEFPNDGLSEKELTLRAREEGIGVYPLSAYYIAGQPKRPALLLGYANLQEAEIKKGMNALEKAWKIPTLQENQPVL